MRTRNNPGRWRLTLLALVLTMIAAACGGGETTPSPAPGDGAPETTARSSGTSPSGETDEGDEIPLPVGSVTIGNETFNFSGFNCRPNHNGTFQALLLLVDENGELTSRSDLDVVLIRDDAPADVTETDSIRVRLGHLDEDFSLDYTPGWFASAESAEQFGYPAGASQVDSVVIDGNTASGTATFIDGESDSAFARGELDSVESVQGTFTVTCAG